MARCREMHSEPEIRTSSPSNLRPASGVPCPLSRAHRALSKGLGQLPHLCPPLSQVRGVKGVFLANQKVDGKVVTLITYNKGRDWDRLRPPSVDMSGKPTNCKPVSAPLAAQSTLPRGGPCRTWGSGRLASEKGHLGAVTPPPLWAWRRGPLEFLALQKI